ncbi:MAG: hypothetical protein LBO69_07185 [Ignavibacteria bacterium]|jgi:hypothetical protein|nr:hypothetical protein [Ignavibacteria bacterium]
MNSTLHSKIHSTLAEKKYIYLTDAEFMSLNIDDIEDIVSEFGGKNMLRLPETEIRFFEWVKEVDEVIWNDIWGNDDLEPYLVSVDLLPIVLSPDGRGFPICDVQTADNYFFSMDNMVEESRDMIEAAKQMFLDHKPMTAAQLLALEISFEPIDIWHFAYKHNIDIAEAKRAVHSLVDDGVLVHLKEADYIIPFIHF